MDNGTVEFGEVDFAIDCPSTVTNNNSTDGFPASYPLNGTDCRLVNNK